MCVAERTINAEIGYIVDPDKGIVIMHVSLVYPEGARLELQPSNASFDVQNTVWPIVLAPALPDDVVYLYFPKGDDDATG